ncbi:MAG: SprB repeat-containing protein, partial [Chitinophagaceae bacterium]|nr:SprB repeat-containing protein [Chitinophagaceae bacterium]
PVQNTATASGLAAGSYTVNVTDAKGCTKIATVTISQSTSLSATTAITNIFCNGGSNGSVVITPSGGTGPYTITPAQTGLAAGNYTFTITDANGCSINVPVTINEPSPITATTAITNVSCNGGSNGAVVITPSGGTGPYTITPAQTGLAAGNYTFTVKDANGCSINVPITINEPSPITATTAVTNVSCNGGSNGAVVITPSGGTGPYTITPAQTGLAAGNYTFTITDANGCSITVPIIITEPSLITATTAITNVSCNGGSNGSVIITPSGGTAPYTITPAQTGLAVGNYTFTITDANGCSITVPIIITEPSLITATTAITNVSCNGGNNGSVVITPSGGTAPYTITPAQTGLAVG